MILVKGRNGKSKRIAEDFVFDGVIIVETLETRMSHLISEDIDCSIFVLESNKKEELEKIVAVFTSFMNEEEGKEMQQARIIFYVNITEHDLAVFKEFDEQFPDLMILIAVQADNEEIEVCNFHPIP